MRVFTVSNSRAYWQGLWNVITIVFLFAPFFVNHHLQPKAILTPCVSCFPWRAFISLRAFEFYKLKACVLFGCLVIKTLNRRFPQVSILFTSRRFAFTVEPRFNEPLFNENLDITNGILRPSNSKIYEKEPRYNELSSSPRGRVNRRIWPVPSNFVKSRFHCTKVVLFISLLKNKCDWWRRRGTL